MRIGSPDRRRPAAAVETPVETTALPEPLFVRFSAARDPRGGAVVLVTIDPSGLPRTALLAPTLLVAASARRILFPLSPRSRSAANLRAGRKASLFLAGRDGVFSIAGDPRESLPPLASLPGAAVVELRVRRVKMDAPLPEEKGAGMLGGLPFHAPPPLRAAWRRARKELFTRL